MLDSRYAKSISDVGFSGMNHDGDEEVYETAKTMAQTGHGGDDDDDDHGIKQKRDFGRAKQVILFPFLKAKKKLRLVNKRASSSSSCSSSSKTKSISSDKRIGTGGIVVDGRVNQGCGFCFAKFQNLESKNGPQTSDPNDRKFTHDMLKVLIEKNDFYSKESNPHLVTHLPSCNNSN